MKQNTTHELILDNTDFTSKHTVKFPYVANKINIINDSLKPVYYSFNGRDIDGKMLFDDESHNLSDVAVSRMWFKTDDPDATVRLITWAVL